MKGQGYTERFEAARALLEGGAQDEAVASLEAACVAAEQEPGRKTPRWARAHHELGTLLTMAGRLEDAIAAYREAICVVEPNDPFVERDRLAYIVNLGELLRRTGRLDEARRVLRRSLRLRLRFYGESHPGYAFGLIPMVELHLDRGEPGDAHDAIDAAVANLWNNAHPAVGSALALRAQVLKTLALPESTFEQIEGLPDPIFASAARETLRRATEIVPVEVGARMLDDLIDAARAREIDGDQLLALQRARASLGVP